MSNKNDNIISTKLGSAAYYTEQLNARSAVPDHPEIIGRWQAESAKVRQSEAGLLDLAFGSAPMEQLDFFPAEQAGAPLLVIDRLFVTDDERVIQFGRSHYRVDHYRYDFNLRPIEPTHAAAASGRRRLLQPQLADGLPADN